jgi:putative membrane protein
MVAAADAQTDYFRWVPHPEVWLLVVSLVGLYVYAARVIGPKVVPTGTPAVTRSQWRWFTAGIVVLWLASDWPIHDIGEEYLFLVHMVQHLLLTLVMPPMMLLATPEWLARLIVGDGRVNRIVHRLARPVPAGAMMAIATLMTHAPAVVNTATEHAGVHYGVHTVLVLVALLFWIPVAGPFPELRIALPGQMIYLFVQSLVPTVPGAWMVFADNAVYSHYDIPARLWGISVVSDQQAAGAIMKLAGGTYLWVIITVLFFRWAAAHEAAQSRGYVPTEREILTWDQVERAFSLTDAPTEEVPDRP